MKEQTCLLILAHILFRGVVASFGEQLSFRTLAQGTYSGFARATNLVLRTRTEWEKLWKLHQGTVDPATAIPAVDFEKEMVLAVTMGRKPTGGYAIKIKRIEPTSTGLIIFVAEQMPGPGALVTQAFSAPFHFVAAPKSELKPDFRKNQ